MTQFSIPALLKPMINKMADEASAILLLICSHEVWVKVTYDWSKALCLCLCLCRLRFHRSKLRRKHEHKKNELVRFSCAYAYAYVDPVFTCLHMCLCLYLCICASKNQAFFLKRNGLSIYKLPPADCCQAFFYCKVMRLLRNEKEFHPPPHDDTDKKIFGAWLMR